MPLAAKRRSLLVTGRDIASVADKLRNFGSSSGSEEGGGGEERGEEPGIPAVPSPPCEPVEPCQSPTPVPQPEESVPKPVQENIDEKATARIGFQMRVLINSAALLLLAAICIPHERSLGMVLGSQDSPAPSGVCGIRFDGNVPILFAVGATAEESVEKLSYPSITQATGIHPRSTNGILWDVAERVCVNGINTDLKTENICFTGETAHCVYIVVPDIPSRAIAHSECDMGLGACE